MKRKDRNETSQLQDKPQSSEDWPAEYRRLLFKALPFEVCLREVRYLAESDLASKRIRCEALELLRQMEKFQKAEADENAGEKAEAEELNTESKGAEPRDGVD